jgi:pimeloyl-ACP methyl ester carboxylesterase
VAPTTLQTVGGVVDTAEVPAGPRLDLATRAIVAVSATTDLAARTVAASVVAGAALPWAMSRRAADEQRQLGFYRELADLADAAATFPRPPRGIPVTAGRKGRKELDGGRVQMLRFDSPFVAANPELRKAYAKHTRNASAWAQHWRHDDGVRPTLCVVHGFFASPFWLNSALFSLPWYYEHGYDVLLYVMPFHGPRQHPLRPVNGSGLFAHGIAHFNEAIAQAICDLRVLVDHLEESGVPAIGLTGLSLGGYVSALLATVEERLRVVIANAPVVDIGALARQWFPASLLVAGASRMHGIPIADLERALRVHSPLNYQPVVPKQRRMIIGGLGDRLAPPDQARALWEHWGRPRLHWYPGNHMLHVRRGVYLKEMQEFMSVNRF